jgi:hypothetical protein
VVGVAGKHGNLRNPAGDDGRPYLARAQAGESASIDGVFIASTAAGARRGGIVLREGGKGTTQ